MAFSAKPSFRPNNLFGQLTLDQTTFSTKRYVRPNDHFGQMVFPARWSIRSIIMSISAELLSADELRPNDLFSRMAHSAKQFSAYWPSAEWLRSNGPSSFYTRYCSISLFRLISQSARVMHPSSRCCLGTRYDNNDTHVGIYWHLAWLTPKNASMHIHDCRSWREFLKQNIVDGKRGPKKTHTSLGAKSLAIGKEIS